MAIESLRQIHREVEALSSEEREEFQNFDVEIERDTPRRIVIAGFAGGVVLTALGAVTDLASRLYYHGSAENLAEEVFNPNIANHPSYIFYASLGFFAVGVSAAIHKSIKNYQQRFQGYKESKKDIDRFSTEQPQLSKQVSRSQHSSLVH